MGKLFRNSGAKLSNRNTARDGQRSWTDKGMCALCGRCYGNTTPTPPHHCTSFSVV